MRRYRHPLWLLLLVIPSIACQAVMQLVASSLPTSTRVSPTAVISSTPSPAPSCVNELSAILHEGNDEHLPLSSFPSVDTSNSVDVPLVTYQVNGDQLSAPALENVPPALIPYQRDFNAQQAAWKLFTAMIPAEQRRMLAEFIIMTDGPGGVLSAVEQTPNDPARWILETDIADSLDTKNLAFTLLHESGHLLTLNSSQVPPDLPVFDNPNSARTRDRAIAACGTYFPGEGCSLATSYVNTFFNRFWTDLYEEWSGINRIDDQDRRDARLHSFYRTYNEQFVDSYAATSPVEDIAETWAYFVLSAQPSGQSISDQKMSFFYAYPQLATLRQQIRSGLCRARP